MVDHNLIKSLGITDDDVDKELSEAMGSEFSLESLGQIVQEKVSHQPGNVLTGRVVGVIGNEVIIEVGLKSEGAVDISEFRDSGKIEPGQEVEVFLEEVESEGGLVVLSKRKADRIRGWQWILENKKDGDVVTGRVTRKIKGGLLMDIGVPAFLPASQVDIRRPSDIGEFIGKEIEAKILKIDQDRRNIVVSRRKLIEERRAEAKEHLLAEIEEGQIRKGVVKNIADFGAFVDLGGLDGLLHITDMSWGRIGHPSEVVKIEEEIEIVILKIDREKEKVALGLKQMTPGPWENVEEKFPVGSRVKGTVVNIMSYGAFVKLEEGLEGLVHISEMSWTRRVNHPSEMVEAGQEVEVVVLDIDKQKEEISLGMKQAEVNPWTLVKEKYPPGTVIKGMVRNMTNFGAFVEIEEGIDGMLHVSDLSWTRKISHPSEMLKKGQDLQCVVLAVDEEKMRVSLGLKQLSEDPWLRIIPEHYLPGQIVRGRATKLTNFGVFVELEDELEGLLHVSELADRKVDNPEEIVKVGEEIEVKILRVDSDERKIGLSLKRAQWAAEEGEAGAAEPVRRRGGLAGEGGLLGEAADDLIQTIRTGDQKQQPPPAAEAEEDKPAEAEPEAPQAEEDKPAEAEPGPPQAEEDKPAEAEPGPPQAEEDKPAEAEPGPPQAEEDKPAEAEPEPPQAEEDKPAEAEPEPPQAEEDKPAEEKS